MYIKDFDSWNQVKKRIQGETRHIAMRKGEIRWTSCGINLGSEIDGKGVSFTRPALILHVVGSELALTIPLSSKRKDIAGYIAFEWKGKTMSLCIHQMRIMSQKRILDRIGRVSENRLDEIKSTVKEFYSL